jgi:thiamine pyrophosphokinase
VTNVRTDNLKWPLKNETLYPDKTRGISNEMLGKTASVSIGSGLLLIVHRRQDLHLAA